MVGGGFYEPILVSIAREDPRRADPAHERLSGEGIRRGARGCVGGGARLGAATAIHPGGGRRGVHAGGRRALSIGGPRVHELHGDYICEDGGRTVRVFPGLKVLRYLLPFGSREEAIAFLREAPTPSRRHGGYGRRLREIWRVAEHLRPDYRDGWLEGFFTAWKFGRMAGHDSAGRLCRRTSAAGRADLPTASYSEMMEWALPTPARDAFHPVAGVCEAAGRAAFFPRRALAGLLHQICRIESVAQKDAARFGQATQLRFQANEPGKERQARSGPKASSARPMQ